MRDGGEGGHGGEGDEGGGGGGDEEEGNLAALVVRDGAHALRKHLRFLFSLLFWVFESAGMFEPFLVQ